MENSIQDGVMKAALMGIDGISELEEKVISDDEEKKSTMFNFTYMNIGFSSLYSSQGKEEQTGINFRTVMSIKLKTKKTRVQILNDINKFNHSILGIKVVLLSIKDRDLRLSFDFESWTLDEYINTKTTKIALDFVLFSVALFQAEHSYMV